MHFGVKNYGKSVIFAPINDIKIDCKMFRIPPITKNIIFINVILFAVGWLMQRAGGFDLTGMLALHFVFDPNFHIHQFVSYLFMHGGIEHLFFNMLALWMFGGAMEQTWGARKFLLFYFVCGIGAGVVQEVIQLVQMYNMLGAFYSVPWSSTVGASGAIYGILLAFGMTYPDSEMIIFPIPIPIKAKYFVFFYAAIELISGVAGSSDGVAHFAHLGGMLFGFILMMYWRHGVGRMNLGGGPSFGWFKGAQRRKPKMEVHYGSREYEFEYNMRNKERTAEIDRILDKLRQSGYESLTVDEKKKLFDASQK